jgi:hypothetical protein
MLIDKTRPGRDHPYRPVGNFYFGAELDYPTIPASTVYKDFL